MSSVENIRKKSSENHNLARLLKYVDNKLTVFKVTEIYQDIVKNTMSDNQNFIDSIDECKVVVIILNELLENITDENSVSLLSQIEIVNCTFELCCEVITKNICWEVETCDCKLNH